MENKETEFFFPKDHKKGYVNN
jgi:hypothetical protein